MENILYSFENLIDQIRYFLQDLYWDFNPYEFAGWIALIVMLAGFIYLTYVLADRDWRTVGIIWFVLVSLVLCFLRFVNVEAGNTEWDTTIWHLLAKWRGLI